jgi:hypothetical protein
VPSGGYSQLYTCGGLKELTVQDSLIRGGYLTDDCSGAANRLVQWNNSLFERLDTSIGPSYDITLVVRAYNNLFYGGRLIFNAATGNTWVWRDNVFDKVRLLQ